MTAPDEGVHFVSSTEAADPTGDIAQSAPPSLLQAPSEGCFEHHSCKSRGLTHYYPFKRHTLKEK